MPQPSQTSYPDRLRTFRRLMQIPDLEPSTPNFQYRRYRQMQDQSSDAQLVVMCLLRHASEEDVAAAYREMEIHRIQRQHPRSTPGPPTPPMGFARPSVIETWDSSLNSSTT